MKVSSSRALRWTVVAVASFVVGSALSWSPSPARADTASQLSSGEAKLRSVLAELRAASAQAAKTRRDLGSLFDRIDASRANLEATQAQLVDAQLLAADLGGEVRTQQSEVDQRAAEAYMHPVFGLDVLLGASSVADLQERLRILDAAAQSEQSLIGGLVAQRAQLDGTQSRLQVLQDRLASAENALESQAAEFGQRLREQQAALDRLDRARTQTERMVGRLRDQREQELARAALLGAGGEPPPGAPIPPHAGSMSVTDLIQYFFAPLGTVNMQKALCVGYRESRYDPSAVNQSSGAAGVFQFMPFIWPLVSRSAGWGGASVFDPVSNVAVAAWMMGHEGWRPWAADAEACGL